MAMTFQQQLEEALKRQQPAFRPTYEGLLSEPQAQITTPETFQPGLLNQPSVGRQLGLLGLSFAPGAGISDYAGTYPSSQGGFEPGFQQNVQQGNYLTAGLQGLGAFGDMATATGAALGPLGLAAGMGVGSIAKAPRAVQRGVEGLIDTVRPKLDDLGFFSQVEKSVMDIPQQKGTGQQFLAQIQKTPGVKPEELQYTGLDQFLANKPTVTKGEIQDYLDANRVQLQEVTLGGRQPFDAQKLSSLENEYLKLKQHPIDDPSFGEEKYDEMIKLMNIRDQSTTDSLYRQADEAMRLGQIAQSKGNKSLSDKYFRDYELFNTRAEKLDLQDLGLENPTKFSQYTLPGGENYREVLLTLPAKQRPNQFTLRNNESGGTVGSFDTMEEAQEFMRTTPREDIRGGNWSVQETTSGTEPVYRSSHFDQPNILAHMRVNDRTIDGKPTLFIEEVQSDWHQAGRKQGYATGTEEKAYVDYLKDLEIRAKNDIVSKFISDGATPERAEILADNLVKGLADDPRKLAAYFGEEAKQMELHQARLAARGGVPDAPFKTSWDELTLKRAIKMASDEGYDQIAFTTGKTQAERYALSRSVDSIDVRGFGENRRIVQINGKEGRPFQLQVNDDGIVEASMYASQFEGKPLDEVVGKDVAKQLMDATDNKSFSGLDLDIGGEGMKGFYDKMLPKKLEKIGKKYGAKPTKSTMQTPDGEVEVWTFNIPKEMRETVKEQGQPLFQIGVGAAGLGAGGLLATEEEQY